MKTRFFILLTLLCICMSAFSKENMPSDSLYRVVSVYKRCKHLYVIIAAKNKKLYYIISPTVKETSEIDLSCCEKIKCGHKYDFKLYFLLPCSERLAYQWGFTGVAMNHAVKGINLGTCLIRSQPLYHNQIYEGSDNIKGRYFCKCNNKEDAP